MFAGGVSIKELAEYPGHDRWTVHPGGREL